MISVNLNHSRAREPVKRQIIKTRLISGFLYFVLRSCVVGRNICTCLFFSELIPSASKKIAIASGSVDFPKSLGQTMPVITSSLMISVVFLSPLKFLFFTFLSHIYSPVCSEALLPEPFSGWYTGVSGQDGRQTLFMTLVFCGAGLRTFIALW